MVCGLLFAAQTASLPHVQSLSDGLVSPARLAIGPTGAVWVTDPTACRVVRFDAAGAHTGSWPVPAGPIGIAQHPDGRVFVSLRDEPGVAIFDTDFQWIGSLGAGDPAVTFERPTDVDIATDTGRIYVVDADGDRIYVFEPDGSLALKLGTRGHLPGTHMYPSAITVDETRERLIVADHDMYRMQVFTTGGVFLFQFGGRLDTPETGQGFTPRTQGLAADDTGGLYVADALMNTVRKFDATGSDLGIVVPNGHQPGALRVPCDVALSQDGSRLYVASVDRGQVEVFATVEDAGDNSQTLRRSSPFGWPVRLVEGVRNGPHLVHDRLHFCKPCHDITNQPGGDGGTVEGQTALCLSCHNAGGRALTMFVQSRYMADPFGTNPGLDGRGTSHAWGIPAWRDGEEWSRPDTPLSTYLGPNDEIKCATCHNQHDTEAYGHYLRVNNDHDALCKSCHDARTTDAGEPGSHPVGVIYPAGQDGYPAPGTLGALSLKDGRVECMTCHDVHNADSGGACDGEGDGMLLRRANDAALCQACHTQHLAHATSTDWQPACNECHDVHDVGSTNSALIARDVEGVAVTFVSAPHPDTGPFDYIHGPSATGSFDGLCETCHTATDHHRNSSTGNHSHFAGMACTICHTHEGGFAPMEDSCLLCHADPPDGLDEPNREGAHAVHLSHARGPHIENCDTCHLSEHDATHDNGVVDFASGEDANHDGRIDLSETDTCDACHGPDGAFDGVNDPVIGAKVNWYADIYNGALLADDKADWCLGCHDTPGAVVHEVTAPAVAGDNMTWGFKISGHGMNHYLCTECHDANGSHTDGIAQSFSQRFPLAPGGWIKPPDQREIDRDTYNTSYRLKPVDGARALEIPRDESVEPTGDFRLCFSCHDEVRLLGVPDGYWQFPPVPAYLQPAEHVAQTNFRNEMPWGWYWHGEPTNAHWQHLGVEPADWDVDHDGFRTDSRTSCVTCHNPHGAQRFAGGATHRMTRADLDITLGLWSDGNTVHEYGYIGSDEYMYPGGDMHCRSCHADIGPGEDPPNTGLHSRYYRRRIYFERDECLECHP